MRSNFALLHDAFAGAGVSPFLLEGGHTDADAASVPPCARCVQLPRSARDVIAMGTGQRASR